MKGILITFEGTEGCGKTTQIKKISEFFNKKKIDFIITQEPGGTKISNKIREILMDPKYKEMTYYTELFLYLASRNQHIEELIIPALNSGKVVVCDRFIDSTVAYQCFGRKISRTLVDKLNKIVTHGIDPDLTFIIDIPVEIGLKRAKKVVKKFSYGKGDRLEQENMDFHNLVWDGYKDIASKNPERVKLIKGTKSKEVIFKNIKKEIEKKLKKQEF